MMSRNLHSQVRVRQDALQRIVSALPETDHRTQDLKFLPAELQLYNDREVECSRALNIDWAQNAPENMEKILGDPKQQKYGSRFQ
jgi:hypothetical protein